MHKNGIDYVYDITDFDEIKKVQSPSRKNIANGSQLTAPSDQKVSQENANVNNNGVKHQIEDRIASKEAVT